MKISSNKFLYTNFNLDIKPNTLEKSDLTVNYVYNLMANSNRIEPTINFTNYFEKFFSADDYYVFASENSELINSIFKVIPYEYFDTNKNDFVTRIFVLTNQYKLFELSYETKKLGFTNFVFETTPQILFLNECLIIVSPNDLFVVVDKENDPYLVTSYPSITKWLTSYLDSSYMLFDNYKYSVFSSSQTEILSISDDSSELEEIKLKPEFGIIENIIEFDNYILIFQQYKITKLSKSSSEHKLYSTSYSSSKIYGNTVQKMNDYVLFMTSSGLVMFDGNDTKEIFSSVTQNISGSNFSATLFNNSYYLATKYYINGVKENVIIKFDIAGNNCVIFKFDEEILDLCVSKNVLSYQLLATLKNNNNYRVYVLDDSKTNINDKKVAFNKLTFGTNNQKVISKLIISGAGEFDFVLSSENDSYFGHANYGITLNNFGFKGQYFELEIMSNKPFLINSVSFDVDTIEDGLW